MSDVDWISIIAVAEFAGLVTLVLAVLLTRGWRGRRRDQAAVDALVQHVRRHHDERRAELEQMLGAQAGLQGEELAAHVKQLIEGERGFYDHFISTYLTRDSSSVRQMDERLKAVIQPYLEMNRQAPRAEAAPAAEQEAGPAGTMQPDLEALSEDLTLYRRTLNRLFGEYTAMFGVHLDPSQELSATEILGRLESGQLTGPEEEAAEAAADGGEADGMDEADALIAAQQQEEKAGA